jgi:Fic family protein
MQYDYVVSLVLGSQARFSLTIPIICELHRLAMQDVYPCAGKLRTGEVGITNTSHKPPGPEKIQELCEQMCSYVASNWNRAPIHLAAYLMWRHNWIHPFNGGNGRTSRAISYLVLCAKLGYVLPGTPTIPQQIVDKRDLYYAALRAADAALLSTGSPDVRAMEQLLAGMLAIQLYELHKRAVSDDPSSPSS